MQIMRYDFTAPTGKHFGIIQSLDEMVAALPGWVDRWTPAPANVTQVGGLVTEWRGALGRTLTQATAARQPALVGSEILFGDGAGAAKAVLGLSGTQLGAITELTIAGRFRLPASALATDLHYMFGMQTPNFRIAHRYTTANNYIRFDVSAPSVLNTDVDLAAGVETMDVILTISGATTARLIANGVVTTATLPGQQTLSAFSLGNTIATAGDWPGWGGKFGILEHAVTDAQIGTLQAWLAA